MTTSTPTAIGFKRILVPTDFTDVSERALEYAKSIARANDAQILLAHAAQDMNPMTPPEVVWFGQFTTEPSDEQQLDLRNAELHSEGFSAKTVSLLGSIQEEILAAAERDEVDLIVMGTHGRTGVPRFLFGSEAEGLVRHATCPVLLVGPAARPASDRIPSNIDDKPWRPKDVICACDLDPSSAPTAAFAHRIAQEHQSTFAIFHVDDSEGSESKELLTARFESALDPLIITDEKPTYVSRVLMIGYGLGSTIADLAIERDSDLIVMGARAASSASTHLPAGILPQVMAKAPCPVLVLHKH
jgi:nucleotide-binding universal stress UspA family protein